MPIHPLIYKRDAEISGEHKELESEFRRLNVFPGTCNWALQGEVALTGLGLPYGHHQNSQETLCLGPLGLRYPLTLSLLVPNE